MSETPIIAPREFLSIQGVGVSDNECETVILAFCPFYDMKDKAGARPLGRSLFVHVDLAHQLQAHIGPRDVLMVDCVYGGPVCATVLEEMAFLGVKYVVGYGYAGSLRKEIPPGSIVLASSGLSSDGTSREYTQDSHINASTKLTTPLQRVDRSLQASVTPATVWTTDAIYREYPSKVRTWLQAGADIVNMDTSHFYAVSQAVGIHAIYFAVISDYVGGEEWQQQFTDIRTSMLQVQDLILALVRELP